MEILNNCTETKLIGSNKEELGRTKTVEGTVHWFKYIGNLKVSGTVHLHEEYIVSDDVWKIWNHKQKAWVNITENIPTWEQEYQESLLSQYPFEKRVREIISTISKDAENRVNHIMCEIADDVDFEDLVSEHLAKT